MRNFRQVRVIAGLSLALPLMLTACLTDQTVSLEEAKKITATFKGKAFTPPPKTIEDITAILDKEEVADLTEFNAKIALTKSRPPATNGARELALYYLKRGRASFDVGRGRQALADMRKSESFLAKASGLSKLEIANIRHWLAALERQFGNYKAAERQYELRLSEFDSVGTMRQLTRYYIEVGKLDAAEALRDRAMGTVDKVLLSSRARVGTKQSMAFFRDQIEGMMHEARGEWQDAERFYQAGIASGRAHSDRTGIPFYPMSYPVRKGLIHSLIRQGRLMEAEIKARDDLIGILRFSGKNNMMTTTAISALADVLDAQGRYRESESLLRASLKIFKAINQPPQTTFVSKTRLNLGRTLTSLARWQEAVTEFKRVEQAFNDDNRMVYDQWVNKSTSVPLALIMAGDINASYKLIVKSHRNSVKNLGPKHSVTAMKGAVLAMALAARGDRAGALKAYREALPILLSSSRQSDSENESNASKTVRLTVILEAYIKLLSEVRGSATERQAGIDAAAEAFRIADVARSRSVQAALAASSARAAAGNPALAELVRREQDTRKRISSLFSLLANGLALPSGQQDKAALLSLRKRIDDLRKARAALAEEIEDRFPAYAELINPKPATVAKARAILNPSEALIATYVIKDKTFVWAVPKSGKVAFAQANLGEKRLAGAVAGLRKALDPQAQTLGDIPDFNIGLSNRLYRLLLEPVRGGWKNTNSLLVVAHKSLGQLPFSTFVTKRASLPGESGALFSNYKSVPWLARTHAVTLLPSVSSLAALRGLPPAKAARRNFAGFGDPYFSTKQAAAAVSAKPVQTAALQSRGVFKTRSLPVKLRAAPKTANLASAELGLLPRLPDTFDEVRSIALAMNADLTRDVFTGARANENAVKTTKLSGYKVITFATHGLVPGDLNGLRQPALALSAPAVSGHPGDDGLLTMGEILGLRLDADWVVLSACNTGAGNGAGAEAFSGLGRAFFYAGTRAVLLSNWPVETSSARLLTTEIFKRQAGSASITRAESVRQSMLSLIDGRGIVDKQSGKTVFSYAHPIFWAPFSLVGDGGGGKAGG